MNKDILLYDYATCQNQKYKNDNSIFKINSALNKFHNRARILNYIFNAIGIIGSVITLFSLLPGIPSGPGWTLGLTGVSAIFVGIFGIRLVQNRKIFTGNRSYEFDLPSEIEELLKKLAAGDLHAFATISYGAAPSERELTSDGHPKDFGIARETFRNRFAPLLLSPDPKVCSYVWMQLPFFKGLRGPIYVTQETAAPPNSQENENTEKKNPSISENEAPPLLSYEEPKCQNKNPRDKWLVGGTYCEFEQRRETFLSEKIPSYRHDWFRLVLTVGRRVMLAGGQRSSQSHAADVIEQELQNTFGTKAMPRASENSRSIILKVLQGKYVDGMKDYFLPPEI